VSLPRLTVRGGWAGAGGPLRATRALSGHSLVNPVRSASNLSAMLPACATTLVPSADTDNPDDHGWLLHLRDASLVGSIEPSPVHAEGAFAYPGSTSGSDP